MVYRAGGLEGRLSLARGGTEMEGLQRELKVHLLYAELKDLNAAVGDPLPLKGLHELTAADFSAPAALRLENEVQRKRELVTAKKMVQSLIDHARDLNLKKAGTPHTDDIKLLQNRLDAFSAKACPPAAGGTTTTTTTTTTTPALVPPGVTLAGVADRRPRCRHGSAGGPRFVRPSAHASHRDDEDSGRAEPLRTVRADRLRDRHARSPSSRARRSTLRATVDAGLVRSFVAKLADAIRPQARRRRACCFARSSRS